MADYASKNLEAMNPPLFLRFLNLLMNDAIFLLDEAIQVKKKKKKLNPDLTALIYHHTYFLLLSHNRAILVPLVPVLDTKNLQVVITSNLTIVRFDRYCSIRD